MDLKNTVEKLKQHDKSTLKDLYAFNKEGINFILKSNDISLVDAEKIFHESVVVFWRNAKQNKIKTDRNVKAKTYLFGIIKILTLNHFSSSKKLNNFDDIDNYNDLIENELSAKEIQSHYEQTFKNLFNKLGDKCKKLLTLFFYNNFSMEAIAENLNFANETSAKSQKYKCLQKLKKLVDQNKIEF